MQREAARQLKDLSGWHWVGTHTTDCRGRGCAPHATKEEAQECQYEYELTNAREMKFTSAHSCKECAALGMLENWTPHALAMGGYMGQIVHLCDLHRNVEVLRKHTEPPSERWVS
jgi:hypothetical protein